MLVVTTTMRMVDGVHSNTTSTRPAEMRVSPKVVFSLYHHNVLVALGLELVEGTASLQQRLVDTTTTGNDTDHATGGAVDNLLGSGGQLDTGLALIGVVADDGDVVAGGTAQGATVANLLLDVGDDGTLRHGAQGQDVADGQEHAGNRRELATRTTEMGSGIGLHGLWLVADRDARRNPSLDFPPFLG